VEFRVLGPVEVSVNGRPLGLGGARARAVLAMLLGHANQVVSADRLADELWPGQPLDKAAASLQVRLSELRKALRSAGAADRLATRPPGYLLTLAPAELDSLRFGELAAGGTAALAAGDAAAAARRLDEALSLWRGPAFAGIESPSVQAEAGRLEEMRLAVLESRAEALLECGRHAELIAELETLIAAYPLREQLWYSRMLALYRAGRQADALRTYRDLRAMLASELAIEPGGPLRDLHARIVRQDPALDHPASRRAARPSPGPQTRYVQSADGVHIAYQVLGHGDRDIVFVPGLMSHLELLWEDSGTAGFFQRLATLGRLILFDKRDTGLSDRAPGDSTLEERMDDVRAVMRAVGSARAVLFGYSEGAPMSILFAATYPERVTALILGSAAARWSPAPGYPCGQGSEEMFKALSEIAAHRWGQGASIDWYLPSQAGSPHARQMFARFERLAVSPSAFLRMLTMIREIDVREVLPAIHVPTLVIQRLDDLINPPCHGRYLASRIEGARYFEQPGDHSLRFAGGGDNDALFTEIADFLTGPSQPREPDRALATVLVAKAVGSTAAGPGQHGRPGSLASRGAVTPNLVQAYRGRLV
jgi:DNA-binding SARP family transcriptional activator/pimeloyl-ACP methyl ester carboxylesterase